MQEVAVHLNEAISAHTAGELDLAKTKYKVVLQLDPNNSHANFNLAVLYLGLKNEHLGLQYLRAAVKNQAQPILQHWRTYIEILIKVNKKTEARKAIKEAGELGMDLQASKIIKEFKTSSSETRHENERNHLSPKHKQIQKVKKLFKATRYRECINVCTKILKSDPNNLTALIHNAVALCKLSREIDAIKLFKKVIKLEPASYDAYNNLAIIYSNLGRLDESLECSRSAFSLNPDQPEVAANYANALMQIGDFDKALTLIADLKCSGTRSDVLELCEAEIQTKIGNLGRAEEILRKILVSNSHNFKALNNLGNIYFNKGLLEKSLKYYLKALEKEPSDNLILNNIAKVYLRQSCPNVALSYLKKAAKNNASDAECMRNLGIAYTELSKYTLAHTYLVKATKLSPREPSNYNALGNLLIEQGDIKAAVEMYSSGLRIDPKHKDLISNIQNIHIQIGESLVLDQYLHAVEEFEGRNPTITIKQAILNYIRSDIALVKKNLKQFKKSETSPQLGKQEEQFCTAYFNFLNKLCDEPMQSIKIVHSKAYHFGESHSLTFANKTLKLNGLEHKIETKITFGCKAYHLAADQDNKYKAFTKDKFTKIPVGSVVFLSFGEIDTRQNEGFVRKYTGCNFELQENIKSITRKYVEWFHSLNRSMSHEMFFFNVPAPVYLDKYTFEENKVSALIVRLFNQNLANVVNKLGYQLVDVYSFTANRKGFSNNEYHIDNRHLKPAALKKIEQQFNLS